MYYKSHPRVEYTLRWISPIDAEINWVSWGDTDDTDDEALLFVVSSAIFSTSHSSVWIQRINSTEEVD